MLPAKALPALELDKFGKKRNLKISIAKRRFSFSVNLKLGTLLDLFYFHWKRILIRIFFSLLETLKRLTSSIESMGGQLLT